MQKSLESMFWLLAFLVLAIVTAFVAGQTVKPPTGREDFPPLAFWVCFFSACAAVFLFVGCMIEAQKLRDSLSKDAMRQIAELRTSEMIAKETIPDFAVDRRWLKELEQAFDRQSHSYALWEGADPLQKAEHEHEHERICKQDKFRVLMRAAQLARGVRLPPQVTMKDD